MATGPAARPPLGDIGDIAGGAGGNGAERFTESRVERIVALVVALGCAVLGTQAFVNALSTPQAAGLWRVGLLIVAFLPLAAMILALATGAFARGASRLCALSLVVVLAFWPLATAGAATDPSVQPWVWYLLNVATAAAVMAFEVVLQIVWAVLVPALYAAVRLTQIDAMPTGANAAQTVGIVLDAVFALILAGVIIALGWMLRGTAVGIDRARRDAVASYAAAAEADAVETERVAVAALMHDSVLAATQAIANAVQHAGAQGLAVAVRADERAIAVRISDSGPGFAPAEVPVDRLGIRGSIVARMAAAGGRARVQTGKDGTTVRLDWERPR